MRISLYPLNTLIPSLLFFSFLQLNLNAQLIGNPDFEDFSECPITLGEVVKAVGWEIAVESSDYYNCDFYTSDFFPTTSQASSGDGCMGMASYGIPNGAAEAIGTQLLEPMQQGEEYLFLIDLKMPNSGSYVSLCSGISFYGFLETPELPTISEHISSFPGAVLLDSTEMVVSTEWVTDSIRFVAQDNYEYLVISNGISSNCAQYVFVDNIRQEVIVHVEEQQANVQLFNNLLNPGADLQFSHVFTETPHLRWYDLSGKVVYSGTSLTAPTSLTAGFYLLEVAFVDLKGATQNGRFKVYIQ